MFLFSTPTKALISFSQSLIQVRHEIFIFQTDHKSLFKNENQLERENSQTLFQNFGIKHPLHKQNYKNIVCVSHEKVI